MHQGVMFGSKVSAAMRAAAQFAVLAAALAAALAALLGSVGCAPFNYVAPDSPVA
jgi:hypothetical protein